MDFTLVMTASVNPNGMGGLSPESVANREDQYIKTLCFYKSLHCVKRILFCENSSWDLSRIKATSEAQKGCTVEWLSIDANAYPRRWGKGYGEMLMMDKVCEYISAARPRDLMIKVTGRFPILNIGKLIDEFSSRSALNFAIDIIDHPLYDWLGLRWRSHAARTICYAVSIEFYKIHIHGMYTQIPKPYWGAEELMMAVWQRSKNALGVYPRFKHEPIMSGYAGGERKTWFMATNYGGGLYAVKRSIRQLARWFFPFLWL